jgi:hypothetical protein
MGWRCGSSGRVPAWKTQSPKSSKLQDQQEKILKKNLINQEQLKLKFIIYHPDLAKSLKL